MRHISNASPRNPHVRRKPGKRRRSPIFTLAILLGIALPLLGIYFIAGGSQYEITNGSHTNMQSTVTCDNNEPNPQAETYQYRQLQAYDATQTCTQADVLILTFDQLTEISNDHLLLINIDNPVPSYISGNLARVSDYVRALNPETLLDGYVLARLRTMFDSAVNVGFTQFRVTQGFRTHEYQQNLFDTAPDQSLVAPPGHSEHQVGLAVDISYEGVNIGNSAQGTWLMENSYRYGFILRYPQHKTHITNVPFEPWHYRYVGQPHAYFMTGNDLVLEEYIDLLRAAGELTVIFNGTTYRVYYLSGPDESIEIQEGYAFWASRDNTGGIIVTMYRLS